MKRELMSEMSRTLGTEALRKPRLRVQQQTLGRLSDKTYLFVYLRRERASSLPIQKNSGGHLEGVLISQNQDFLSWLRMQPGSGFDFSPAVPVVLKMTTGGANAARLFFAMSRNLERNGERLK
jgi:hypothetical protein